MSKFLKFIVHFVVIFMIICVVALAAPPFFGVTTEIQDDSASKTNLALGSVTYAVPVRSGEIKIGDPLLVTDDASVYRYNLASLDLENGRGTVIDEKALIRHLNEGRLYAGLDVFETEPLPKDSPLWSHPRALITPHCSGNMTLKTTVDLVVDQFLEDLDRYCSGLPLLHAASVKRGY